MTETTCYRHPDRETGVSCSNCDRPICPDCMTPTPVGMRCPECSRERTKVTRGTASFGRSNAAPATYVLIGLSVLGFVAELFGGVEGLSGGGGVTTDFGLVPVLVADGEWYRLITSGFLHFGPFHLLLNMFGLYILGTLLEPVIGSVRFVALYVASLLAGALGVVILDPGGIDVTAGASGAIFGLFAAAFVISRGRGMQEIASQLGFLLLINLAFTFGVPGISIGGHLGGLVGGGLCAFIVLAGDRGTFGPRRVATETALMLGLAALCLAGGILLAQPQPLFLG